MSRGRNLGVQIFSFLFIIALAATSVVWVLRGLRVLNISGGVIWVLLLLSISLGVISIAQRQRRY